MCGTVCAANTGCHSNVNHRNSIGKNDEGDHTAASRPKAYTDSGDIQDHPPADSYEVPSNSPALNVGGKASSLKGVNTAPDRIASPQAAVKMVDQVKSIGGGTIRIQMTHNAINNPAEMAKLKALVSEGDKQNVKIQFTFRDDRNGGGGNVLTGGELQQAANDLKKVVSQFRNNPSFVVDTFNEGGKSATQEWATMQTTLIKAARDAGYRGAIVVEDSSWGGGITAGGESGLVKYASQLKAANGSGNPGLIGSIHEYDKDSNATARLTQEIKALAGAGYEVQIGEYGNANWTGGSNFEERDGAVRAVKANISLLRNLGAIVLPWMDQFVGGRISHTVGFSAKDQIL